MSTRFWIGIVQTFVQPGIWTARSSSPPNRRQLVAILLPEQQPAAESRDELLLDRVEDRLRLQDRGRGRPPVP